MGAGGKRGGAHGVEGRRGGSQGAGVGGDVGSATSAAN